MSNVSAASASGSPPPSPSSAAPQFHIALDVGFNASQSAPSSPPGLASQRPDFLAPPALDRRHSAPDFDQAPPVPAKSAPTLRSDMRRLALSGLAVAAELSGLLDLDETLHLPPSPKPVGPSPAATSPCTAGRAVPPEQSPAPTDAVATSTSCCKSKRPTQTEPVSQVNAAASQPQGFDGQVTSTTGPSGPTAAAPSSALVGPVFGSPGAWPLCRDAIAAQAPAQHAHLFVEGCTCGAGIVGCCPCAFGAGAHGGMQGMGGYGDLGGPGRFSAYGDTAQTWSSASLAIGTGLLGLAGIYFGARAFVLNGQAQQRVEESLHGVRQSARQAHRLQAARAALTGRQEPLLRGAPASGWQWLARAHRRYDQLERQLHSSLRERQFERWIPGALQATASLGVILTSLPIPALAAFHPVLMPATGVLWAAFGAAYTCMAVRQGLLERRRYKAMAQIQSAAAADMNDEVQSHERAMRQARSQYALAVGQVAAWSSFALGTAALALPDLVAPLLGAAATPLWPTALGAGLAATWLSASARRPVHQLTSPATLSRPIDPSLRSLTHAETALMEQQRALGDYVAPARQGLGRQATSLRLWMAYEQSVLPQCGPKAYGAVAARAEAAERVGGDNARQPLDERSLARTVVRCIDAEMRMLAAWQQLDAASDEVATPDASERTSPELQALTEAAVAESMAERAQSRGRLQRQQQLEALRAQWQHLVVGEPLSASNAASTDPMMAGDDLRLATLMAFGLAGERLAAQPTQTPPLTMSIPHHSPLPFLQQTPVAERWPLLAHSLRQTMRRDFVRIFCNPHRIDEALWALRAEMGEAATRGSDGPLAPVASAPVCSQCR